MGRHGYLGEGARGRCGAATRYGRTVRRRAFHRSTIRAHGRRRHGFPVPAREGAHSRAGRPQDEPRRNVRLPANPARIEVPRLRPSL